MRPIHVVAAFGCLGALLCADLAGATSVRPRTARIVTQPRMLVASGAHALILHKAAPPPMVSALAVRPQNAALGVVDAVDPWSADSNAPVIPVTVRTRTLERVDPWSGALLPESTHRRLEIDLSDPWSE